jgi:hypothetical protein
MGRASSQASEAELAARRGPANPSTTPSCAGAPKRGACGLAANSPTSSARPVVVSTRSIRAGLPATTGFGQSSASSAVSAFPGAMTSAVAAGWGMAAGAPELGAGVAAALTAAAPASWNGSNELATAIATRVS